VIWRGLRVARDERACMASYGEIAKFRQFVIPKSVRLSGIRQGRMSESRRSAADETRRRKLPPRGRAHGRPSKGADWD
jgi:hypothetical protein